MRYAIAALALAVPLAACNAVPVGNDAFSGEAAEAQAVRAVEGQLQAAFRARDAAKVASFYAPDAEIMVAGQPIRAGADQLKGTEGDFRDTNFSLEFVSTRLEVSGEMAFTRGTYTVTYTNPGNGERAEQRGTYLTVFRKQADGSWKIAEDISTPGPARR